MADISSMKLAPSLIEKDKYGNPVISSKYNSNMLIAAVAKLNGYNYAPDPDVFWKQGIVKIIAISM